IADHKTIGDHVILDRAHTAHKGMLANPAKLMKRRAAAEDHIVINLAVTGQHHVVREDDMVTDDRVMTDMGACEKGTMIANARQHTAAACAGVHGDMFADQIVRANVETAWLTLVFQVLRRMADGRKREYLGPCTNARVPFHNRMGMENDTLTERDIAAHNAIGADGNIGRDLRPRVDNGSRVYFCHFVTGPAIIAPSSHSATS